MDPLIIPKNRKSKLKLTSTDELLYKKAVILLQDIASINYDVKHASNKKTGLPFPGKPEAFIFPTSSNNFIKEEDSTDAFAGLTNRKIDVAIYSWMVQINDPNYFIHNSDQTELVIITGLDDQWKNLTQVTASNLRNHGFIVRNKGYLTRECIEQEAKFGNFTPKIIYTVPTMKLMIDLVRRNIDIALARKIV